MSLSRVIEVVLANILRNKRGFLLASFGLVVGVATFTFFVALGMGIQAGVLNRIYPVNQIEVEPATVGVVGLRQDVVDAESLGPEMVETLRGLPHVTGVFPKMRSRLQSRLWGGKSLFGYNMRTEAFFDGLAPELLAEELQLMEHVAEKRARAELRHREACKRDEECPLGQECASDDRCRRIEYWQRFAMKGVAVPCEGEGDNDRCPEGMSCLDGLCAEPCGACGEGRACVAGRCAAACGLDGDCGRGEACVDGGCERLACTLERIEDQYTDSPMATRGRVLDRCANGVEPDSPGCEPMACPGGTYCAGRDPTTLLGWCESPVPVLLSPFLIEVFNSSVASSLGLQQLDGTEAVLGIRFRIHLGGSFFTQDLPKARQAIKLAEIVGFSDKSMDFGATMPLDYVKLLNTRFKGREAATTYSTFILETEGNEDVSALIGELEERGFALSRKSQDARKAADLLFILTVVFSFISVVIMGVAAVNILHTFLMLITERRHEIGIMRAIGATRADVRKLVLVEAMALGVFGAIVGEALSWAFSRGVNWAAARYLEGVPFKPDDFFVFDWRVLAFAVLFAIVFCVIGAVVPANRAARLDPARVLVS